MSRFESKQSILKNPQHLIISDILIILVIYEIKMEASQAFVSLSRAMDFMETRGSLFVYDNSKHRQSIPNDSPWLITYQHNPENPGVSKAYNEGHRAAKESGKKWMMLCDQDSEFPFNIFKKFSDSMVPTGNPQPELLVPIMEDQDGIVSPFRFKWGKGLRIKKAENGFHSLKDLKFINSGLLISTCLFEKSGGYDERFPLDFSDLAFIKRTMKQHEDFMLVEAVCKQRLSSIFDSPHQALTRFKIFIVSSRIYGKEYGTNWLQWVQSFFRAVKLTIRSNETGFFFIFVKNG